MRFRLKLLLTALFVFAGISGSARADRASPRVLEVMNQYFDLLISGNTVIAGDMWAPECLERAQRFGITFQDIPLKADCSSPFLRTLDELASNTPPPVKRYDALDSTWAWVEFSAIVANQLAEYKYYVNKRGDWYWITYPQDYYCADWPVQESRYFRVHVDPNVVTYVNPLLLAEADRFIDAMADTLELPGQSLKEIENKKIEYFFCNGDTVVERITEHRAKGMLDLPSNDIISAVMPHYHELVHLLINIKMKDLPLYTLPLMREGMAVRYGGRWGKSTSSLIDLGVFLYREKILDIDSMLTMRDFQSQASADIVYPLSGVFSSFLIDRLGLDKTLDLYLELSGPFKTVNGWTNEDIQAILTRDLELHNWDAVKSEFNNYIDDRIREHVTAVPGRLDDGKVVLDDGSLRVTEDRQWLAFEFAPQDDDSLTHGNLLFARIKDPSEVKSILFEEQYHDSLQFEGYRFGVRYDRNEAGLYDYLTNQLVAKYIWGISPSDKYFDDETKTVAIQFKKTLLDKSRPEKKQFKLLPN